MPANESLQLTSADRNILQVFLDNPETPRLYQHALAAAAGLRPASAFITLTRLKDAGWLSSGTENGDVVPAEKGRLLPPRLPTPEYTLPPRTWWELTPAGARLARAALNR